MRSLPGRARMRASYTLDDPLSEDSVGPDHQGNDHQDVGGEIFGATAHDGVDVAGGHVLDNADDEAADDGARDRVEPAQDDHGEHFETHQGQVGVDAEHVAPENAAERRDDPGHRPGQAEVPLDINAHRHGHLLVVSHGTHRDTLA